MAVPEQTPFIEYTANGTTTVYPLTFDCDKSEYLIVSLDGEEAPVGSWSLAGGSITFNSAPANGVLITIKRNTPFLRTTEYQSYNNSFRPSPVNKDFDLIWWKLQELGVTNWLTDTDIKNLNIYVNSLNEETREDFFKKLFNLEQNTNAMLEEAIANGAVSALAVTVVECLDDLVTVKKWQGRTVNVRSVIRNKHLGGGTFVFNKNSTRTPDGYIVVADVGGNWEKITVAFPTVDDFGGLGDDPNYDDADAFIRCALSPYTGSNIYLANRQVEYRINKQVDCKGKGIVGGGFSRQNATAYAMNSLKVRPGDYSNSNTLLNNVAFINVGAEVRDLQLVSEGVSENISGLKVDGYNFTLSNANISGFYNQVYLSNATVSFRVQNLMSISAANAGFFIADVDSRQSTTAYFDNCSWQWGKYPVLFAKEAYQCVFNNIILEYMQYGLTAGIWSNCSFNAIWAEQTRDGVARDWLVNTSYQQTFNCTVNNLYIRTPWLNRADPTALGASDNIGGVVIDKSRITLGGATGAKIQLSPSGLATLFANWYGGINRRLLITTQPTAADSGYKTPIHINAPNSELYFGNQDETSVSSVVFKRVIGATAANTPYVASDAWTKKIRKWNTYNHEVSKVGRFIAPMMLTYDVNFTTQQNNAGWSISKESTGVYRLQRDAGVTTELANPHIFVSGIFSGTGLGDGKAILPPTLQAIEA
ncbi:phage tail fiber protein, partial [Acinetobacter baumannii]